MNEDHEWQCFGESGNRRRSNTPSPQGMSIPNVKRVDDIKVITRWEEPDVDASGNRIICIAEAGIPQTDWAKDTVYRLRYAEYRERERDRIAVPGIERDIYDDTAIHLLARMGSEAVGTLRLIPCENGFPMEREREVKMPDGSFFTLPKKHPITGIPIHPEEVVEASRWVGRKKKLLCGDELLVSFLLVEAGMNRMAKDIMKRKYAVAALDEVKLRGLMRIGWKIHPFTEVQEYRGGMLRGAWMDLTEDNLCPRRLPKVTR